MGTNRDSRPIKVAGVLLLALVIALMMAGVAAAATPQDIYDDYAADGTLNGTYTQSELNAVLTDPTLSQYADQDTLSKLKDVIRGTGDSRSEFPFTGSQMLLFLGGGVGLVLVGVFLRRGRRQGHEES